MAYHDGYAGGYGGALRQNRQYARFYRTPDTDLVLVPIGTNVNSGLRSSEGFEQASDTFRVDEAGGIGFDYAQTAVADAWTANSGAAIATLKAAIHSDLTAVGFTAQDGTALT